MVDIRDLGLIPRILFATDGAITHILEAYAGEVVDLILLSSSMVDDPPEREELGLDEGEAAIRRLVLLRGQESGRTFVHGHSIVILDRLPAPVADELLTTGGGLLTLLTRNRIGTFRESVAEWEGNDPQIARRFGIPPSEILVGRTYEVAVGGRPVAWITETFPKNGFLKLGVDPAAPSGGTA